jgi:L-ascorbate metabolism protein UlaG (beta-lactamase superfamily)
MYLRHNVQVEPLFNQWYAYPHLIAPATAAMHIANSHLKIMKSYVISPAVHAAAVKNPAMLGGPFIDYQGKRVDEIKALMEKTQKEQSHMIEFAEAVKALSGLLATEAKGYSIEPLYEQIPQPLKGYVELFYDLNHNASVRFIEGLLYKSKYYNPASQSIILSLSEGDDRPFAYSTPRLDDAKCLQLQLPFAHSGLDELFKMKYQPQTFAHVKEALNLADEHDALLASFLTDAAPPQPQRYDGDKVRVHYYGHACVLVETKNVSILTDPVISYYQNNDDDRLTYVDLPETIDYVLITHSHADHLMFESLLQLRHKIKNIVVPRNSGGLLEDPSLKQVLLNTGFKNVIEVDDMETIPVEGGEIMALPFLGEHADLNIRSKTAYLVRLHERQVMFVADSNNLAHELYEHVHDLVGDVDVLFIGMECEGAPLTWIYGSLFTKPVDRKMDRSRRLSGSDFLSARDMVNRLKCKQVYVYAMGQEPWLCYLTSIKYTEESKPIVESNKLVEGCKQLGIEAERLYGNKEISL